MVRQIIRVTAAFAPFAAVALAAKLNCDARPQALIEDVNVIDVASGTVKPRQDVLIADGRIAAIADHGSIPKAVVPVRVYAGGQYLLPGILGRQRSSAVARRTNSDSIWVTALPVCET